MRPRTIVAGIMLLLLVLAGTAAATYLAWPQREGARRPVLAEVPPLPPATGRSVIMVPAVIPLTAVRDALEAVTPHALAGKRDLAAAKLISQAELHWDIARGPLAVYGKPELMAATTALKGTLRATGQLSGKAAGRLSDAVTNILGENAGRSVEQLAARPIDQRAEIAGSIAVISRLAVTPNWRLDTNLTAQLTLTDVGLTLAGLRINVANEVRPYLQKQVNEEVAQLQERLREDPVLENAVRREWAKLCRAFPLASARAGLPNLWLEVRPTRAIAAQPRIDGETVTLLLGLEAETRVIPEETKPDCPFPANLDIADPAEAGRVNVAVPIDISFTEINRLIEHELVGRTFADDSSGLVEASVRSAKIAASGDRLLLSLGVVAKQRSSWLGLATEGTVHIWAKPVLDAKAQVLRLTDVALAVESEGMLGSAVRAAVPFLERALAERAVVDLKPHAADARNSIEAMIAEFRQAVDGVQVAASVTDLRLTGIAFDAATLRIVAEADGVAKVTVTKLAR